MPLFDRAMLPLDEEPEAARQYLAVMQLRLGERLRWRVEIEPASAAVSLPPGLLLPLVENAVKHGVQKCLCGAEIDMQARVEAGGIALEVRDGGPGLAASATDNVGLENARARLVQGFGGTATLTLANRAEDGCSAASNVHSPPHRHESDCPYRRRRRSPARTTGRCGPAGLA